MLKTLKRSILVIIFAIAIYIFVGTNVNAAEIEINSINEFKEYLTSNSITEISADGNTITVNSSVTLENDSFNFKGGEYILDLKGNLLGTADGLDYCNLNLEGAKLTIKDTVGTGKLTKIVQIDENSTLTVKGGTFQADICCEGTAVIENGEFKSMFWNSGNLTIKDGKFLCLNQNGTATIEGGTFGVGDLQTFGVTESLYITSYSKKTILKGGTFIAGQNSNCCGIKIDVGATAASRDDILPMIPEGYRAKYSTYSSEFDMYGPMYFSKYGGTVSVGKNEITGEFRKISTDWNLTVNSFKPEKPEDVEFLMTAIVSDYIDTTKYEAYAGCADYSKYGVDKISVMLINRETGEQQDHVLNVTYNPPNVEGVKKVKEILGKMKDFSKMNEITSKNAYMLDDLYLINFLQTYSKGFDGDFGSSKALNFAKELINATNGGNIYFKFDPRAGEYIPTGLYDFALGEVVVYYDGTAYTSTRAAITANHIIYIPDTTEKTTQAYENAVLQRIKEYIGTDKGIEVKYGGTLASLNYQEERYDNNGNSIGMVNVSYNENGLIDESASDGNYYNIKINGATYKFVVLTKETNKLETPKYVGSDIISNISVLSDSTTIPLNTSVMVEPVISKEIENTIGTTIYAAYDISLYSNAIKANITKLENGKFIVSVPVPENLKDKEITVYYITSTGEKELHKATVTNEIASFETDHFSTYILAESPQENLEEKAESPQENLEEKVESSQENLEGKDETPKTGIQNNQIYIAIIIIIGAIFALIGIKGEKN